VLGQHPDRIGARTEKGGVAERHDAGIAEREIERQREQDHSQQLDAEAEIAREHKVEGKQQDPRDGLPQPDPVAVGERDGRRMIAGTAHAVLPPNNPCGRQSSSRMVSA
jgi:hypothetical protein